MVKPSVSIVRTGTSNLASVVTALTRAGAQVNIATTTNELRAAERLILPGVGAFGTAMNSLRMFGLEETLVEKIFADTPTLAICLGMQMLFETSEESPDIRGLSIMHGHIQRFSPSIRNPHLGWNFIQANNTRWLVSGYAYFAHSYFLSGSTRLDANIGQSEYDVPFIAAFETPTILACQFHPELSGAWGAALIQRWLGRSME